MNKARKKWYLITDKEGMELGEAEGWNEADALLNLCVLGRFQCPRIEDVHFELLA